MNETAAKYPELLSTLSDLKTTFRCLLDEMNALGMYMPQNSPNIGEESLTPLNIFKVSLLL